MMCPIFNKKSKQWGFEIGFNLGYHILNYTLYYECMRCISKPNRYGNIKFDTGRYLFGNRYIFDDHIIYKLLCQKQRNTASEIGRTETESLCKQLGIKCCGIFFIAADLSNLKAPFSPACNRCFYRFLCDNRIFFRKCTNRFGLPNIGNLITIRSQ